MRARVLWSAIVFPLCLSCGGGGTPPPAAGIANPPRVSVKVAEGTVIAPSITVTVEANGCDVISQLEVFQGTRSVAKVPFTQSPMEFTFQKEDLRYEKVVGPISFGATATCSDGRVGEAVPTSARFFPVVTAKDGTGGELVVPEAFYAEGSGTSVSFLGCTQTASGPRLVRVNREGAVLAQQSGGDLGCTLRGYPTERDATSGKRWWIEPAGGVFAVNDALQVSAQFKDTISAAAIGTGGDLVFNIARSAEPFRLRRISHVNGSEPWKSGAIGLPIAGPVVVEASGGFRDVLIASQNTQGTGQTRDVLVERFNFGNGDKTAEVIIKTVGNAVGGVTPNFAAAFSTDGSVLFFTEPSGSGSHVLACLAIPANGQPCTSLNGNQLWSGPTASEEIRLLAVHNGGNRLVVATPSLMTVVATSNGTTLRSEVRPSGVLGVAGVLVGPQKELYLFNGVSTLPQEIVAFDDSSAEEAFRFDVPGGSLWADTDDSGKLWLRVGTKLVEPLPTLSYRTLPKP